MKIKELLKFWLIITALFFSFNTTKLFVGEFIELKSKVIYITKQKHKYDKRTFTLRNEYGSFKIQEETFYKQDIGVNSEFLFAKDMDDARLMVISGKGFLVTENNSSNQVSLTTKVPLYRDNEVIKRNYCAFWKKENSNIYIEEFVKILEKQHNK